MNEYWKDPRLDDEGTYDYLVEELPSDTAKWQWYYQKCDSCGKYHRLNFDSTHYFYCWDGWDSMSYAECWRCKLRGKISGIKARIKKKIKQHREYHKMIKMFKNKNMPITKELKEATKQICQ
jgi:hypothetical protein